MMISLFQNQPEDNGYFVYLINENSKNPYDLTPKLDWMKPRKPQPGLIYHTLTRKGITTFHDGEPFEYQSLSDWLLSRD
jgi:hypothetical protein